MSRYELRNGPPSKADYTPYGGARDFMRDRSPEVIISGPAETGKTLAALYKLHICACKYPKASIVIARKTLSSTHSTVLVMFREKVLGDNSPAAPYGGEKPEWYDYPNGARIWLTGMDKSSKVLSSEHDIIYVNQAEELSLANWETLTTRATGRAGHMPYAQTIGDCNPSGSGHWIVKRSNTGALHLIKSYHKENPALFNQRTGEITEQGQRTMATLEALTGHRRKRLLEGEWASPEGLVYEQFDEDNVSTAAEYAIGHGPVELAVDDGFAASPRVILFIQVTEDGTINVFDEIYHTRHLAETCVNEAVERLQQRAGKNGYVEIAICDPSAVQLIATFRRADIPARGAKCGVVEGIKWLSSFVQNADAEPKLLVHPRCKNLIEEMSEGYCWPEGSEGKGGIKPVKENDHGPDALRYWVWARTRRSRLRAA